MNTLNILALLEVLLRLNTQAVQLTTLFKTARAENRDVTDEELDALAASDDAADVELSAAIAAARARAET